jgi:hypothetical protein
VICPPMCELAVEYEPPPHIYAGEVRWGLGGCLGICDSGGFAFC